MKKPKTFGHTKLALNKNTLRLLNPTELQRAAAGGASSAVNDCNTACSRVIGTCMYEQV